MKSKVPRWQSVVALVVCVLLILARKHFSKNSLPTSPAPQTSTQPAPPHSVPAPTPAPSTTKRDNRVGSEQDVLHAISARSSDVIAQISAKVYRLLPDDNDGSRHQRFILQLRAGQTLLVAHNIDLAPRVPVAVGDTIELLGEYEWNEQGGVMHWTHHDPGKRRPDGWILHNSKKYE